MTNTTNYGLKKPDPNDYVNIEDLNYNADAIDTAMQENKTKRADLKLSNLDTPQEALANLGAGVRANLAPNWDLSINQRGQTSYNAAGITIDGVKSVYSNQITQVLTDGTLSLSTTRDEGSFWEWNIEKFVPGKTYTISIVYKASGIGAEDPNTDVLRICRTSRLREVSLKNSDVFIGASVTAKVPESITDPWFNLCIRIAKSTTLILKAVKIEEGETQTLYIEKENGSVELLPQPDRKPGQMLAECQRYYIGFKVGTYVGKATSPNSAQFIIPIPMQMRTTPVLSDTLGSNWRVQDVNGVYKNLTTVAIYTDGVNSSYITLYTGSEDLFVEGEVYTLTRLRAAGDWSLSCEL